MRVFSEFFGKIKTIIQNETTTNIFELRKNTNFCDLLGYLHQNL